MSDAPLSKRPRAECRACQLDIMRFTFRSDNMFECYTILRLDGCPRTQFHESLRQAVHAPWCSSATGKPVPLPPYCDSTCVFCTHIIQRRELLSVLELEELTDVCLEYVSGCQTLPMVDGTIDWYSMEEGKYRKAGRKETICTFTGAFRGFDVAPVFDIPYLNIQLGQRLMDSLPTSAFCLLYQDSDTWEIDQPITTMLDAALNAFVDACPLEEGSAQAVTVNHNGYTITARFCWELHNGVLAPQLGLWGFSIHGPNVSSLYQNPDIYVVEKKDDLTCPPLDTFPFAILRSGDWIYLFFPDNQVGMREVLFYYEECNYELQFIT